MTNDTIIQKAYAIHMLCVERDRASLKRDYKTFNKYDTLLQRAIEKLKKEIKDESS